ncbi:MAG TPA: dockerin type I domain-containing protein [Pirellulaceae bacterium]
MESLETRALLTAYTYPFGATPNDTAEYMLGDIAVNVVLMESDPAIAPNDNGNITLDGGTTVTYTPENWTPSAISAVKTNVQAGLQWWKDTFANMFPNAPADSLNFDINWQYADNPVDTGYEPIARYADDLLGDSTQNAVRTSSVSAVANATQFSGGNTLSSIDGAYIGKEIQFNSGPLVGQRGQVVGYVGATHTFTFAAGTFTGAPGVGNSFQFDQGWLYDFLDAAGFAKTGIYSTDMRSFNDYTRQQANADWAFTIFVVNNANDPDKFFAQGGSYLQAFSFPGGQFEVVPASRPAMTFAHETGHQFWALDEYAGGDPSTTARGYYDTQNLNAEDNPAFSGTNEVQSIAPYQGTVNGGTFKLTINLAGGKTFTTAPIAYNASPATIQAAIDTAGIANSTNWVSGSIAVSGTGFTSGTGIKLTFSGSSVRWTNQPMAAIDGSSLTGGGTVSFVKEITAGGPPQAQQGPTIMGTDHLNSIPQTFAQSTAFNNHVLDPYTMANIGWQDSDGDGIMDVLDVPFTLTGTGSYDPVGGVYSFRGASHVNTLPNQNSEGTQDDVTINQVRQLQYQLNNGAWIQAVTYPDRTYSTSVSLDVHIPAGSTIHFRTIDTRTGVTSNIVTGTTDTPTSDVLAGLAGTIYLDQNADAHWDNGEPTEPGVALTITDQHDAPLALQHTIEPDNSVEGAILNNVDSAATLTAVGLGVSSSDVAAGTYPSLPSAGKVFTGTDDSSVLYTWNDQRQLRIDFKAPVSTVSIRAYGASATTPSYARLDAYNSSGQVIARFNSDALTSNDFTTMTVGRSAGDIAYAIAYGWSNTDVVLDTLTWGPPTTTTSDSQGAFSLNYLPDGTYHIHISPATGFHTSNPVSGVAVITVSGGVTADNVNFGVASDVTPTYKFHNYDNRYSVNPYEDNQVTALDALIIINYINAHPGNSTIPLSSDPTNTGYIDVVADGVCAANDVLSIINYINANPQREAEAESAEMAAPATTGSNSTAAVTNSGSSNSLAEGEYTVQTPVTAADYYTQQPVLSQIIRGAGPCNCAACRAARGEAVAQLAQPAVPLVPPAASAAANGSSSLDATLDVIAADVSQLKASDAA